MSEAELAEETFDFSSLNVAIGGVPAERIVDVWPRVAPLLERVLNEDASGYTLQDVMWELHDGMSQLWVVEDFEAVFVTKILRRPQHCVAWCWMAAGDNAAHWIDDVMTLLEAWAKANGCQFAEFSGRKGWAKYCKPAGYRTVLTTFRKDLRI